MHWSQVAVALAALGSTVLAQTTDPLPFPASCPGVSAARYPNTVDSAWKMTKLIGNLKQPRTVIWDPLGQMLVLEMTKGVSVHTFNSNGCVATSTTIISNVGLNHGLSLTPDGKTLYASSQTTAWSWDYDAATRKVSNQKTVIKGIGQGIHSTRTMVVVPQAPNIVLVSVGSNNNWDYQSGSPATGRACIKAFDMSKVPAAGYNYNTDGYQMGYGLRNEVGIAIDPAGMAWGVENSGDDFRRTINGQATDIHIDNPGEEVNYLGDPTKPNDNWYGYPTCFTVWGAQQFRDATFKTGDQFVVSPNSSFNDASCTGKSIPPRLTLPAHTAPITNAFDKAGNNMYVTLHGSWNRQPAAGYSVIEIPFTKTADGLYEPVAKADSSTGFKTIFAASNPGSCQSMGLQQSSCFRLAGLGWDPAGTRLMVTSDNSAEGEIFILAKK